jgi:hypothetical protein
LPVDIIQLAIRNDTGVGDSRLEVAMILLTRPLMTTPRPAASGDRDQLPARIGRVAIQFQIAVAEQRIVI